MMQKTIRIFTLQRKEVEELEKEHDQAPHLRAILKDLIRGAWRKGI